MVDPHRELILLYSKGAGEFEEKTKDVKKYTYQAAHGTVEVDFGNGRLYPYSAAKVRILRSSEMLPLAPGTRIEVLGRVRSAVTGLRRFTDADGDWLRLFSRTATGKERFDTYPAAQVRVLHDAGQDPSAAAVLKYWRGVVAELPGGDPLVWPYRKMDFVDEHSVLGKYLVGAPIEATEPPANRIFPFSWNISQRQAIENALSSSISVIQGPPGTGKTETILNLIANIIASGGGTVGVVSFTNAAVDNVREKLEDLGLGHIVAALGNRQKVEEFFARQQTRNAQVVNFLAQTPPVPSLDRLADLGRRLTGLQEAERLLARHREQLDAFELESRHFAKHLGTDEIPALEKLPLLHKSSDRIIDYLVETKLEGDTPPGLIRRIRKYFRYGALRGLDPDDTAVVLRLETAFYDQRVSELKSAIEKLEKQLQRANFDELVTEHRQLSADVLHVALAERYKASRSPSVYLSPAYKNSEQFAAFTQDYPVILSTCHSLRENLPEGFLLDYLIIDEASQVGLLQASLALSAGRNLIVVGDLKQLPHIPVTDTGVGEAPSPPYDCFEQNILTSLIDLYADALPIAMLREHYRCDPAIIGFCNKKFYDGQLMPYKRAAAANSMVVRPTAEGNHMRRLNSGGTANQRELEVISQEVVADLCRDVPPDDIAVIAPYRLQADRAGALLGSRIAADTVHKFQGRQKSVVILSTVLDESKSGHFGLKFVDNPQMINVAVSRAADRFILVTNNARLPRSRHYRDLIGYIEYQNVDEPMAESGIVSMFDLLYTEFSDRLTPFAARLKQEMKYKSDDIIWTLLGEILAEDRYQHLAVKPQVLLRDLLLDVGRLTERQRAYVGHRASLDFVVHNRITNENVLAIEVNGFEYHENKPVQRERDELKAQILAGHGLRLLPLSTTGSQEPERIRAALDALG